MKNNLLVKGVSIATVLTLGVITASPVLAYTKDETVYGKMSNSGENYNTVVSTHLKNTENESILKDISDLLNIKNINGDETFEVNENILKWWLNYNAIKYIWDNDIFINNDINNSLKTPNFINFKNEFINNKKIEIFNYLEKKCE